jgi:class 3 adenylate cyclase/tetratricopeptide (TPR) repeat protein
MSELARHRYPARCPCRGFAARTLSRVKCVVCGADNKLGRRFCSQCGASLQGLCASCGAPYDDGERFCGDCGSQLHAVAGLTARGAAPGGHAATPASGRGAPIAERRLVSVLFADLVGFTALSELRDAEATRDLLSRYFELARTLIGRYGGTVEKFIGDAVMAVWGTPVATESDAERAVRAALDLVASVPELDPGLKARAGVLTGEAAVTIGAEGEGMVAGDLVNTASRIQAAAEPGTVLVGDVTRRTTSQAIVYESAGEHELKGKSEPVALWRALRVVSGVGGALKSSGLEAPFVGRSRELKLIKDLFHGSAQERRAHLVSVTGIAGIGKSRLAWEFYKYFDGIVDPVYWQRGRCLAYGEGVAYWALADMIRMRARIEEGEDPRTARQKLGVTVAEHVVDAEERAFVEPRLAHLLGLDEAPAGDRQDLFAAWRLFFERLAGSFPTVLAFEDMQWADTSLLDFVEYLLEWSRDYPIYVITLARPELQERRPSWGAGQRNFTSLYLEPLSHDAMEELLEGLVPGLPERLRGQILGRAQGVPLYAVETVRMLLDRGLLAQEGSIYTPTGEIATLDVPETLHALIAARLDGLSAEERRLLQDGAVLGKTFTQPALSALSGTPAAELQPLLSALAHKEVLGFQSDPRSPERGQYGFLQDLVRHVAYETLSKRERKIRHLAAAAHLEQAFAQEDGVAEMLAAHYVAALVAAPEAEDAPAIRTKTREMLTRAGERAGSIGAPEEGRRYYEQAAALADDPVLEAQLLEHAGRLAMQANRLIEARERLERALALYTEAGDARAAARASAALADVDIGDGRLDEAAGRLDLAVMQLEQGKPSGELAGALAQLGRVRALAGHGEAAAAVLERALTLADRLLLPEILVEALTSRAIAILDQGRRTEALILLEAAATRAHAEQLYASALRAENNLASVLEGSDRYGEAIELVDRATALARRRGDRRWESMLRTGGLIQLFLLGRWDEALVIAAEEEPLVAIEAARGNLLAVALVHCERGDLQPARALLTDADMLRDSSNPQAKSGYAAIEARVLRGEGRPAEALASAERGLASLGELDVTDTSIKIALVEATEAALTLSKLDKADELLAIPESLEPGRLTPFLQAQTARLRARLEGARGQQERVDERFRSAAGLFRQFGLVLYLAVTQLEHAEWLAGQGRNEEAEPLLIGARETFERLRATPWRKRASQTSHTRGKPEAAIF